MTNITNIEKLVQIELKEANIVHPLFHSTHEAYGVIKEEVEETEQELIAVKENLKQFWETVKQDWCHGETELKSMKVYAMNVAREAIQVAAMCQKALDSGLYD